MVAHVIWDHGAGGSSPFTPTIKVNLNQIKLTFIFIFYKRKIFEKILKIV